MVFIQGSIKLACGSSLKTSARVAFVQPQKKKEGKIWLPPYFSGKGLIQFPLLWILSLSINIPRDLLGLREGWWSAGLTERRKKNLRLSSRHFYDKGSDFFPFDRVRGHLREKVCFRCANIISRKVRQTARNAHVARRNLQGVVLYVPLRQDELKILTCNAKYIRGLL